MWGCCIPWSPVSRFRYTMIVYLSSKFMRNHLGHRILPLFSNSNKFNHCSYAFDGEARLPTFIKGIGANGRRWGKRAQCLCMKHARTQCKWNSKNYNRGWWTAGVKKNNQREEIRCTESLDRQCLLVLPSLLCFLFSLRCFFIQIAMF